MLWSMKTRLYFIGISMILAVNAFAQLSDSTHKGYIDIPFSISAELPGVYFMNFQNINTSEHVVASVNNTDYMPGVHFNFGPRERFYVSVGFAGRSYQKFANYTFYSTLVNEEILASAPTRVLHRKYNVTFYKSIWNLKRSTMYGFAGWQGNRTTILAWKLSPDSYYGVTNANFQIRQDWNVDLGMMYEFLNTRIFRYDIGFAIRAGYSFPVTNIKWVNESRQMERLETTNSGGVHFGLMINLL